ncbi:hypothetical protein PHLCEN_2v13243 [Hermanssonia centrifuga]|uniref:DUF6697 domain-containing protein n=1 Tax=Hermanssonia centrifuga TaxID=98765 RepID=A0A2R6NEZ2_9APHY|nr:hypothetical protein PHLCEN_2v13243 [Hermanssonia centrifuga]
MRMVEALLARDHAVYRLESICASLREKEAIISRLQHEKAELELNLAMKGCATSEVGDPTFILAEEKTRHEKEIERLQEVNKELKANVESLEMSRDDNSEKPETIIQARYDILAELPIPPDMPSDTVLRPIVIPSPYTIHDFIGTAIGTTQAIIKETLAGRKNTSPQNIYEIGQLYAAGALKAACIGLQCIGFDEKLYHALLAHGNVCAKSGRWRGSSGILGTGAMWNVSANAGANIAVEGTTPGEKGPTA